MSIISDARKGISDLAREVARREGVEPEKIARGIASGRIVIPRNPVHSPAPLGVGEGLRV
jgi:phosphomethylpyrimidine synthase